MNCKALTGALGALAFLPLLTPSAQLSQPGRPASDWADLALPVPTTVLPAIDVAALEAEDAIRGPFPLRYGEVIATDLGIDNEAGVWEGVELDDSVVWRLRISSPGAHTLGVVFDQYELPVGGQVFLYDDDKSVVLGAYTDANNNVNGLLGIQPLVGDSVTIEYVQQSWAEGVPKLHVGEVIHDYKGVFDLLAADSGAGDGGAGEGGCGLVGINCPEGAPYQTEKRAVMRTLAGGALCSAALLNNTNGNGTPYMLTANHCGTMTSGQFLFEYEQASCGVSSGPTGSVLSGAVKLASTSTYDSQLYRLNTTPPANFNPFYAGWSRSTSSGSPVATIGHGGGGPKNLAIDNNGASFSSTQWQVFWHVGYIIGGNSGGPLFNGQKRVIGPACCVNNFTCGSQTAWYGRFDRFYSTSNLGQWLDPAGTNPTNLDGYDPFATPPLLIGVTPSPVPAFGAGQITLSGTGLIGVTEVHVGATTLTAPIGFTIVSDNQITFNAPTPTALGAVPVSVVKPSGTSNSVNLTYQATDPPVLSATGLTLPGFTASFSFGAQPNDLWFLFVKLNDGSTLPFQGFNVLVNPLFLTNGTLSAVGIGAQTVPVPSSLSGASVYSQVILLDGGTFAFVGATNVGTTTVL